MSIIAPFATQMGLQILLQPYSSFIGQAGCTVAGVIYPAYASFKAVQVLRTRRETQEAEKWLTYWAVYATLSLAERVLDKTLPWLPYYNTLKFAFLLWLQLPRYQGAQRLHREVVQPLLAQVQPHVDDFLAGVRFSLRRPEVMAAGELVNYYLAKVPFLEWFVRGPDGRPMPPSVRAAFLTDAQYRTAEEERQPGTPPLMD